MKCLGTAVLLAALVVACGNDDTEGGTGGAGGAGGSGGAAGAPGGGAGQAGNASTGGSGGAAGDTGKEPILLSIGTFIDGPQTISNAIFVNFVGDRCEIKTFGKCEVRNCRITGDGGTSELTGVSAGEITISGGSGGDVKLVPDELGVYNMFHKPVAYWPVGAPLHVSAAGATVPAFTVDLSLLSVAVLTDPDSTNPPAGGVTIDRTQGITVKWEPTDETVVVGVLQEPFFKKGKWDQIQGLCPFAGQDGTGTLPAQFFDDFEAAYATLYAVHGSIKDMPDALQHPFRVVTGHGPLIAATIQ